VIADKLAELRETIDLARAGKKDAALALVGTDRGQGDTEAIRSITARMAQREQSVVAAQFDAINERGRALVVMDTAGLLGVVLLACVIAFGIRRYVAALRGTQAELEVANRRLEAANVNLEGIVQARTADLTEANEEIQRFAYIVSHDLRAPLVNIMGFTSELETAAKSLGRFAGEVDAREPGALSTEVAAAVDEDIPEAIRFIKASTSKMDRLISAILTLSREGRRVLAAERLDMHAVLTSIADTVRHQATDGNAEIRIGEMPTLMMDRVAVEQIFGNLLDNALKYLKPGRPGVIRIGGRMEGRLAVFEVEDNGRGISPRDHERIFELFRRAGDQSVPGEGIGLAHVRALVRRLGGKIECESVPDQGTVFRVRLPGPVPQPANRRSRSVAA
jgi:signal transduction histidine kinase